MCTKMSSNLFVFLLVVVAIRESLSIYHKSESAVWNDFRNRHIIDPNRSPQYIQWKRTQWTNILKVRIGPYNSHKRGSFGMKQINSFMIGSDTNIANDFAGTRLNYSGDLWWSQNSYPLFILSRQGPASPNAIYNVYNCGKKFIVAGLDTSKKPVHFHKSASVRGGPFDKGFRGCSFVPVIFERTEFEKENMSITLRLLIWKVVALHHQQSV